MPLILYVLFVAATIAGLTFLFAGVGLLLRCAFGLRRVDLDALSLSPIIGWCVCIAVLQVWHLFFPVNTGALVLVGLIGVAGIMVSARGLREFAQNLPRGGAWAIALMVVALLWLASHTTNYPKLYDSGLYHVTSVKWFGSYPIVPGLSNLSREFGHNCAYFLYAALLDIGPFADRFHHLASGVLLAFALFRVIISAWRRTALRPRACSKWHLCRC